jgi:hypothetical protein
VRAEPRTRAGELTQQLGGAAFDGDDGHREDTRARAGGLAPRPPL